jgi:hypothetical protein
VVGYFDFDLPQDRDDCSGLCFFLAMLQLLSYQFL